MYSIKRLNKCIHAYTRVTMPMRTHTRVSNNIVVYDAYTYAIFSLWNSLTYILKVNQPHLSILLCNELTWLFNFILKISFYGKI